MKSVACIRQQARENSHLWSAPKKLVAVAKKRFDCCRLPKAGKICISAFLNTGKKKRVI